jgi:hypothetical protein
MIGTMRIGIGLPAAVPEADMAQIGSFADYEASDMTPNGQGKRFDAALAVMDQAWRSSGVRPSVALGGLAPAAGCTDVVLYPCSGDLDQVERLSQALSHTAVP